MLQNKVVFLTGGADGIGRECAFAYTRHGASVAIADIDEAKAMGTAMELGERALPLACDVRDGESVRRAVQATFDRFGRIDAVHNNAGISGPSKPLDTTNEAEWDSLFGVNLKSVYWTTVHALAALRASKGCILNTASMVGEIGQAGHAAYVATKGGMIALTKAMALDYAVDGIRVNAICPAGVWTPMLRDWAAAQPDPAGIERYLDEIHPLGYCPQGDVIAGAAVFLLSPNARFITGCILPVSGGAELGYRRI
jgi:meso-butanediol dehydrogenase/(S,S)-butanediol dehydrogenase/diacetyl reductase